MDLIYAESIIGFRPIRKSTAYAQLYLFCYPIYSYPPQGQGNLLGDAPARTINIQETTYMRLLCARM